MSDGHRQRRDSVRRALPVGRALDERAWRRRHHSILVLLALHVLGLPLAGVALTDRPGHALLAGALVGTALAVAAVDALGRVVQSAVAAAGLVLSSAGFLVLTGGMVEATFHLFLMVAAITLYESWPPFVVGVLLVVAHHTVLVTLAPDVVLQRDAVTYDAVGWAAVNGVLLLVTAGVSLFGWRLNEEAQAEAADSATRLRDSDERFQRMFADAAVGQALTDVDGHFVDVNRAYCTMTGYSLEELLARRVQDITHVDDLAAADEAQVRLVAGDVDAYDIERRFVRPDGTVVHVLHSVSCIRDDDGTPRLFTDVSQDITVRKQAEQALRQSEERFAHQAFHDALTGLPNRSLLLDRLEHTLARSSRGFSTTAVLFLDLDRFKWVNDSFGHPAGDSLLAAFADRVRGVLRPADTLGRFGGDEFVVLCDDLRDEREAVVVAQRIVRALMDPFDADGRDVRLSVSIGIAVATPGATTSADDLVRDADSAMYRAKARGRDRIELFDDEMRRRAGLRLEIERSLRRALEVGELRVAYQPIVRLDRNEVWGVEALVRWQSPEHGMMAPADFVPMAEETGQIVEVGAAVLRDACLQVARWNADRAVPLTLSVNLGARQLTATDLAEMVRDALDASGLDPHLLTLEVAETVLMEDLTAAPVGLLSLKEMGVSIVVDDFGTGYSSIVALRRLPVDGLKVDGSFVSGLGEDGEDTAVVTAVLKLARSLGLTSVAEGVETAAQATLLARLGCERAQGFHWSRPILAEEATTWLARPEAVGAAVPAPTRVLVVDDEPALRRVLSLALEIEGPFEVVAEAADGREAVALARKLQPDLIVLDLLMPGMSGVEALPLLADAAPSAKVAVLTALDAGDLPAGVAEHAAAALDKGPGLPATVRRLAELVA